MNKHEAKKKIDVLIAMKHRTRAGVKALLEYRSELEDSLTEIKLVQLFGRERFDLTEAEYQSLKRVLKKFSKKTSQQAGARGDGRHIKITKKHLKRPDKEKEIWRKEKRKTRQGRKTYKDEPGYV